MQIIKKTSLFHKTVKTLKKDNSIGFVPTMGALHKGHISLVQKSKEQNDITIVSIFLNPTQFAKNEDLSTYPVDTQSDIEILKSIKCDILFLPDIEQMYPSTDTVKIKAPDISGYILEGAIRDNHFDGVLSIVLKLLHLAMPTHAYFGKKDAQQLILIEKMVDEYFIDTKIVACESIRDDDNLAFSSRNAYLSADNRKKALNISKALFLARDMINNSQINSNILIENMKKILKENNAKYIAITNRKLQSIDFVEKDNTLILICVEINNKRYIDNIWI